MHSCSFRHKEDFSAIQIKHRYIPYTRYNEMLNKSCDILVPIRTQNKQHMFNQLKIISHVT